MDKMKTKVVFSQEAVVMSEEEEFRILTEDLGMSELEAREMMAQRRGEIPSGVMTTEELPSANVTGSSLAKAS